MLSQDSHSPFLERGQGTGLGVGTTTSPFPAIAFRGLKGGDKQGNSPDLVTLGFARLVTGDDEPSLVMTLFSLGQEQGHGGVVSRPRVVRYLPR